MNRILTTVVQIGLLSAAVYCVRLMLPMLKEDVAEFIADLRR